MKHAVTFLFSSTASILFATANPPELGNFEGVTMTGATVTHPISLEGGTFTACEGRATGKPLHKCKVSGRAVVAVGGETLVYNLSSVVVYQSKLNHFYYGGTRTLRIGDRDVTQKISVTINQDRATPDRIWGYLQLNESGVRSSIEAYRKN